MKKYPLKTIFFDNEKQNNKVIEQWKQDEHDVLSNRCEFKVYYLGNEIVENPTNLWECNGIMGRLLLKKNKEKCIIKINQNSVLISRKSNKEMMIDQTMKCVKLVATHEPIPYTWFYTETDKFSSRSRLHGFLTIADVPQRIVNAFSYGLQICSENLTTNKKSTKEEIDQSFKQTPIEKLKDPLPAKSPENTPNSMKKQLVKDPVIKSIPRPKPPPIIQRKLSKNNPLQDKSDFFSSSEKLEEKESFADFQKFNEIAVKDVPCLVPHNIKDPIKDSQVPFESPAKDPNIQKTKQEQDFDRFLQQYIDQMILQQKFT